MSKKTSDNKTRMLPPQQMIPIRELLKTKESNVEANKLREIAQLLRMPDTLPENEKNARIIRAVELYESLAPADGLEGMLAAQMIGTHHAALECLHRAAVPDQTFAGRDMNLKHAAKLMALYSQQVAALDKHRGKGQQKVTVEHVYVAAGGQAIVGNVEPGALAKAPEKDAAAIEHQADVPLEPGRNKTTSRRSKPKAE